MKSVFQTGGSLAKSFPAYVVRPADNEIYKQLKNGNFCYVLAARQMGKSSLRVHSMARLQDEGYTCASVDITSLGSRHTNPSQWYYSFLYQICRSLGLETKLKTWWKGRIKLTPVVRLSEFFETVLLTEIKSNIVIFIDEIDSLLNLDRNEFSTDDFFAVIRAQFNARADNPNFKRLNFVIIGVATPNDLMADLARTPFNIGVPIYLDNFRLKEAKPLLIGFEHLNVDKEKLLTEILYWTGGQPYLTQRLCKSIAEKENTIINVSQVVKKQVIKLFLSQNTEDSTHNLNNVHKRIVNDKIYGPRMLATLERVLSGKTVYINNSNTQLYLQLSGVVHDINGKLVIANKIYENKFNQDWLIKALHKINRPFATEINKWLANNKFINIKILKSDNLEDIYKWSKSGDDVSQLEREFIESVRTSERIDKSKKSKRIIIILSIVIPLLVCATVFGIYEYHKKQKSDFLLMQTKEAAKVLEIKEIKLRHAHNQLKVALQEAEDAKIKAQKGEVIAEQQRMQISRLNESTRLTNLALQYAETNPTVAIQLAQTATKVHYNELAEDIMYKIYKDNSFYKIIGQPKGKIQAVAVSSDSKFYLTGSSDKSAILRSIDGEYIKELPKHEASVIAVNFSNDGTKMLTATFNNTIRIFDKKGNIINSFVWGKEMINSLAFSADDKYLVAIKFGSTISFIDFNGKEILQFSGHSDQIQSVTISNNGKYIATGSWDKTIKLWDITGKLLKTFVGHKDKVLAVEFSKDNKYIISGSADKTLRLWNIDGDVIQIFKGHDQSIVQATFSNDGEYILSGSRDKTIRLWNITGEELQSFKGHSGSFFTIAFSPDRKYIISASADNTIRYWRLTGTKKFEFIGHTDVVISAAISPNNNYFATGSRDATAILWNKNGEKIKVLRGHNDWITSIKFSNNSNFLVTTSSDNKAIIWDKQGNKIVALIGHNAKIWDADISPDNNYVLTASSDNTIRLWSITGKHIRTFEGHSGSVKTVKYSPDGKYFISGSFDNTARLWNINGKIRKIFKDKNKEKTIESVAFSQDGKNIFTTTSNSLTKWSLSGSILKQKEWPEASTVSVITSPSGKYVFTKLWNDKGYLWSIDKKLLLELKGLSNGSSAIAFSEDVKFLLTSYGKNSARIWHSKILPSEFFQSKKFNIEPLTKEQKNSFNIK